MRGTAAHRPLPQAQRGITPACAGNRLYSADSKAVFKDHPRVCGEQRGLTYDEAAEVGSPPRVRGTDPVGVANSMGMGITPACAGNRCHPAASPCETGDHPRVCGEQHVIATLIDDVLGSPPRVRGTALSPPLPASRIGITPACAGNRRASWVLDRVDGDHPRVCGEQL